MFLLLYRRYGAVQQGGRCRLVDGSFPGLSADVHDSVAIVHGHPWMGRADQHQRTHLDIDVRVCRQCVLCPGAPPFAEDCPRMPRGAFGRPYRRLDTSPEPLRPLGERVEQLLGDWRLRVRCRACLYRMGALALSVPHGLVALPVGMANQGERWLLGDLPDDSRHAECAYLGRWREDSGRHLSAGLHPFRVPVGVGHRCRKLRQRKEVATHLQVPGRHILSALHHALSADIHAYLVGATLSRRSLRHACIGGRGYADDCLVHRLGGTEAL